MTDTPETIMARGMALNDYGDGFDSPHEPFNDFAQAAILALKEAGYVICPVEPDSRMQVAGADALRRQGNLKTGTMIGPWRAMIEVIQGKNKS